MEQWKEYKLGDICRKVCSGGTPSSKRSEYYDGDIPWLNTKEINFNRIYKTEKCITEEGLKNSSAKWIEANSVIVAMYGATAGKSAITKIPLTTNQACCNLTINSDVADYRYVYYFLCHKSYKLASLANGGAQQNLNAQIIKDFSINLPSLTEQMRIADVLSSLDDKIEVNRRINDNFIYQKLIEIISIWKITTLLNDNLVQQAQALFKSWFVDYEPFKDGEFEESELGMIPKGWKVETIGNICNKITDGVHNTVKDDEQGDFYLLSCKNIKGGSITVGDNERRINQETFNKLRKRTQLNKGDILLSSVGTIGEMVLLLDNPSNIEFQRSVAIIKPDKAKVSSEFLFYSLKNQKEKIIHCAHGAVQQCLFISDITNFITIYPPKYLIERFTQKVESFLEEGKKKQHECRCLAKLRDNLLPRLMSGEVKVNDLTQ